MFDYSKTYYKFIRKDRIHNNFEYKLGLNVDTVPFNPNGSCQPGGLYFTDLEHVFEFIDYGELIVEIKIPEDAKVYKDPDYYKTKWKADKIDIISIEPIENKINYFTKKGADIHVKNDYALIWASQNGHLEVVRLLLENGADIHANYDFALILASLNGRTETVKLLLEKGADIHAIHDKALTAASHNGYIELVKLFLEKGANVHAQYDYSLRWASRCGRTEIVKLLLEHGADVHAENDEAIKWAVRYNHFDVVKLLLKKGVIVHAVDYESLRWASAEIIKLLFRN